MDRMTGIDAARGTAMVLVCLSHVRTHFTDSAPELFEVLTHVTRLATPTFLLLSGFVAAHVLAHAEARARLTLFDRGLCVLLLGHVLLNLALLETVGLEQWIFGRTTVTDAIAVCLVTAALMPKLSPRVLAAMGATLALASWPIAMTWIPESDVARYVGAVFFSVRSEASVMTAAALVPYLGMFLLGMALSRASQPLLEQRAFDVVAWRLMKIALPAIALVALGVLAWHFGKDAVTAALALDPDSAEALRETFDPRSKLPPSPAYLMMYGGGGLLIAAVCLLNSSKGLLWPAVRWTATLGRASLMCFVLQDWLLNLIPSLLGYSEVENVAFWSVYAVATIWTLHRAATAWDNARANRFLTVGLKRVGGIAAPRPVTRN
jgi:uncharacterized membrane protein